MLAQSTVTTELARVQSENEELKARIAYLEDLIKPREDILLSGTVHLSGKESAVACRFLKSPPETVITREQLYRALYLYEDEVEMKIIDVYMCNLRRKLQPYGIAFATVWGRGHLIDKDSFDRLKALARPQLAFG